jgi:hypothetical protein
MPSQAASDWGERYVQWEYGKLARVRFSAIRTESPLAMSGERVDIFYKPPAPRNHSAQNVRKGRVIKPNRIPNFF